MTRIANRRVVPVGVLMASALAARAAWAFPPPVQANPSAEFTAEIPLDYQNVVSYTRQLAFDEVFNPRPRVYWFKYQSNGRTALKLDTLGSDFGTNGPGGGNPGGPVLGSYNQSQVAVYTAAGQKVAISKGTQNLAGDPIPIFPTYSSNPDLWYHPMGLSEVYLDNGLQLRNPHWDASPSDPTPFQGWAAPGNEGNSQKYFPPYYPTALNEYAVWNTALSTVMLDQNGNPVINPTTNQPRPQPGWRYYDRARHGLGSPWNRFGALPAGEYYFAIASTDPVFAGDQYVEEVLRFPVHFDTSTGQANQPKLTAPMGAFQYYIEAGSFIHYGNIRLNVTQTPTAGNLVWNGSLAGGAWDVQTTQNWKNGAINDQFFSGDNVTFDDTAATGNVNLAPIALTPGTITISAGTLNYTFSGAGSISGAASIIKTGAANLTIANTGNNNYTGGTRVLGGTLEVASTSNIGPGLLEVGAGAVAKLSAGRPTALRASELQIASSGKLDLTNNKFVVDYTGASPINVVRAMLQSGFAGGAWNGGGIITSNGDSATHGIGYVESTERFASFPAVFAGQSVDADALLLSYTRFGDANIDGITNISDFALLAANFNQAGVWSKGDFNYDGLVNIGDFSLLAANFNQSALPRTAIPEPAGLLLMLGAPLLRRRK